MASLGGPYGAYGFGGWLDNLFGYEDSKGDRERSGNNAPSTYFADMYPNPNEQMLNLDNNIFANRYGTAANDSFQQRFGNLPIDNRTLANAPPSLFGPMPGQAGSGQPEGPLPPQVDRPQYAGDTGPGTRLTVNRGLTPPAPYADAAPAARTFTIPGDPNYREASPPIPGVSIGDRLMSGLSGFGNASGPINALTNMIAGLATGQRQDPMGIALGQQGQRQFAMYQALKQLPGMTDEAARIGALNPKVGEEMLRTPELVKEWRISGSKLPLTQYVQSKHAPQVINTGTEQKIFQPGENRVLGGLPIDVVGKETQEAAGKIIGGARAQRPAAILDANNTIRLIDELSTHKGLSGAVGGLIGKFEPVPGTPEYAAYARIQQLQGEAFLQARTLLKGGGQITDFEGKKAENAIARMDRAQTEPEFRAALKDFRDAVKRGIEKLEATSQMSGGTINAGNGVTIRQVR